MVTILAMMNALSLPRQMVRIVSLHAFRRRVNAKETAAAILNIGAYFEPMSIVLRELRRPSNKMFGNYTSISYAAK